MRKIVLYIETLRRGGAERVMSVLANYLNDKHYEVVLITDVHDDFCVKQYIISDDIKRYYLDEMCVKNSSNVIIRTLLRILNIRKICQTEQVDLALSFLGNCNIRLLLATLGLRCKKIVSVRNDPAREYAGIEQLAKILFYFADGCIFQTYEAMEWFGKRNALKSKVIFNPIDSQFYEKQWNPVRDEIVTFGRLVEQKNHILLVKAFGQIHKIFPKLILQIYGDDFAAHESGRKKEIIELIKELKLENSVFLRGNIDNVQDILAESKLFVLTSDYEGMPNTLMEAMTVGVPVISTDCPCGGPALLTDHGKYGELVPCRDEVALVEAMKRILLDDNYAENLSKNEKERSKEFAKDKVLSDWENYLLKINGEV